MTEITINSIQERLTDEVLKVPSLLVFSVGEVQYLLSAYQQQALSIELYKQEREKIVKENDGQRTEIYRVQQAAKETHEQFADLKERLQAAETSNAFNRGYLQRVSEDDLAREGFEQFDTPDGAVIRPRRPPPSVQYVQAGDTMGYDNGRSRPKKTHWVNY